jgi:acetyl-CoA carboxylase biotin carboxyl carrier protein
VADTIKAPFPGTFYRRPNPKSDPYVSEGDRVEAGTIVGMLEIMKNFYEVTSEGSGVVERFLVENEDLVEAGQDLIVLT